ncbi:MAG: WD40 repeat domain-containing protein [Anaerolineae bacterium]|nr:WD40 repeat domain-containing protein [Anaerolineae bacterium]
MKARKLWFFLLVFAVALILALAACGGGDDGDSDNGDGDQDSLAEVDNAPEPTDEPVPPTPTEEPAPDVAEIAALDATEEVLIGTGTIRNIAWSPDSQQVAVSAGAGLLLYDAADLSAEPTLLRIKGGAWSSAYSPDGTRLATSNVDVPDFLNPTQFIHLWDLATGERIAEAATGQERVNLPVYSADGSLVAGAVYEAIYLWDAATLDVVEKIDIEGKPVRIAISGDNNLVAWAMSDGVHVYARDAGEQTLLLYGDDRRAASFVAFSPDDAYLAAGTESQPPLVFDLASGEIVFQGGEERVRDDLRYDPAGNLIISDGYTIKKIDPATGELVAEYRVKGGILSPDESKAVALDGLRLVMFDAETRDEISAADLLVLDKPPLVLPDFSAIIARQWSSSRLHLLDPADGSLLETVTLSGGISDNSLTLSADGSRLAACTRDKMLLVVDTDTWEELLAVEQAAMIGALAFNSDNTRLALSARQGQTPFGVWVIDAATGDEVWLTELATEVIDLIFSPDDTQIIGVAYKALYVLDAATGEILQEIDRSSQTGGEYLDYTPDGSALMLYGDTGFFPGAFINFYDPATYKLIESVKGERHNYGVKGVIFNADGSRMITVGRDVHLILWDAVTRQPIAQADVMPDQMLGLAKLDADAARIVTTSKGGVLQLWTIGAE